MYNNNQYGMYAPNQTPYSTPYGGFSPIPNTYPAQPQFTPQTPNYAPQTQSAQQMNTNKIYVTGIEDAKTRQLPANSDYIFLDNDKPLLYRKTVDATGKMEIKAFKISEYTETEAEAAPAVDMSQYVSVKDFNSEINRIKKTIDGLLKREVKDNG